MRTFSEVDEAQCLRLLDFDQEERSLVPIILQEIFFIQSVIYGCHAMTRMCKLCQNQIELI